MSTDACHAAKQALSCSEFDLLAYGSLHLGFMGPQADGRTMQTMHTEDSAKDAVKPPASVSVLSSVHGVRDDSARNISHRLAMQNSLCVSVML
jgi:hypothetical protein